MTGALPRGLKRPGREADPSHPRTTQFNNTAIYSFPHTASLIWSNVRYGLDETGFEPQQKQEICVSCRMFKPAQWPTQTPLYWVPGFVPGIKAPRLKNEWSPASDSPVSLRGVSRDNLFTRVHKTAKSDY